MSRPLSTCDGFGKGDEGSGDQGRHSSHAVDRRVDMDGQTLTREIINDVNATEPAIGDQLVVNRVHRPELISLKHIVEDRCSPARLERLPVQTTIARPHHHGFAVVSETIPASQPVCAAEEGP